MDHIYYPHSMLHIMYIYEEVINKELTFKIHSDFTYNIAFTQPPMIVFHYFFSTKLTVLS